ncbi:MAG: AraC family transcriptional regulator [Pseudomonadota bacterium]
MVASTSTAHLDDYHLEAVEGQATAPFGSVIELHVPRTAAEADGLLQAGRMGVEAPADDAAGHLPMRHALLCEPRSFGASMALRASRARLQAMAGYVVPIPRGLRLPVRTDEARAAGRQVVQHLLEIHHQLAGLPGRTPRGKLSLLLRLHDAHCYLEESLGEPRTATEAAALANLSRAHFIRLFRSLYRCPPREFRQRCRDALAKRLLADPALQTTEIARRCGFSERTAFHRCFRERTGLTPGEWRRLHRPRVQPTHGPVRRHPITWAMEDGEGERFPGFA